MNPLPGLYIHVPFCRSKCPYCDFYSSTSASLIPDWLRTVEREALLYRDCFGAFDSLYVGGGTPSLLDSRQLSALMGVVLSHFRLTADTEMTVEVNPDDITLDKLLFYRELGFNRISVGAQSFNDQDLLYLKRRHSLEQTERALSGIRSAGFDNMGIDLIYGLENQSLDSWRKTLERAVELQPEHLSCYQLTYEDRTRFGAMKRKGCIKPKEEEEERTFFLSTSQFLEERGYIHYEISNFARGEKHFSRHNQKYWRHVPYLGLGPAAHSFLGRERWWNIRSVKKYCLALAENRRPLEDSETLSDEQLQLETLFMGFRAKHGLDLEFFDALPESERILGDLKKRGLVTIEAGGVTPTLEGFAVADRLPVLF
jgi:oxygen-independent coproporphyrinogen-3 oxidase